MRICHLADSHLGAGENHPRRGESGLTLRQEDIVRAFVEAIDKIIETGPDLCLHAGDLFHSVRPTNRIMAIAGEQLHRLAELNAIPTVIIAGNHDMPKVAHVGAPLEVFDYIDNLYIAASGVAATFRIGEAVVQALPHCPSAEAARQQLDKLKPAPEARYNLLLAHGVAAGMPEFSMADLAEQEFPIGLLNDFDYAALGHYHNHTKVADRAWYAGSTERLSQAEREAKKGFVVIDMDPPAIGFQEVSCRPMIDLSEVDATGKRGDELVRMLTDQVQALDSRNKIVRVTVRGVSEEALKTIPTEQISRLKQESYALDVRFEKEKSEEASTQVGRGALGRIDAAFMEFLDSVDLQGFDRERLKAEARRYLSSPEEE
jgi:DNA repair exonuclease SbcCD nuclease subunit